MAVCGGNRPLKKATPLFFPARITSHGIKGTDTFKEDGVQMAAFGASNVTSIPFVYTQHYISPVHTSHKKDIYATLFTELPLCSILHYISHMEQMAGKGTKDV